VYAGDNLRARAAVEQVTPAFKLSSRAVPPLPLFYGTIR
jgi:hypothetical protein